MTLVSSILIPTQIVLQVSSGNSIKYPNLRPSEYKMNKKLKSKVLELPIPTESQTYPHQSPTPIYSRLSKSAPLPHPTTLSKSI